MRTQYRKDDPTTLYVFLTQDDKDDLLASYPVASANPLRKDKRQLIITPQDCIPVGTFRYMPRPAKNSPIFIEMSRHYSVSDQLDEIDGLEIPIRDSSIGIERVVLRNETRPSKPEEQIPPTNHLRQQPIFNDQLSIIEEFATRPDPY